jgi:hypothetical protein
MTMPARGSLDPSAMPWRWRSERDNNEGAMVRRAAGGHAEQTGKVIVGRGGKEIVARDGGAWRRRGLAALFGHSRCVLPPSRCCCFSHAAWGPAAGDFWGGRPARAAMDGGASCRYRTQYVRGNEQPGANAQVG